VNEPAEDMGRQLLGRTVVETDGSKVGKVAQVYLNDETREPEWVTVSTSVFGSKESFVPLRGADWAAEDIVVPLSKSVIKDAPQSEKDADGRLNADKEQELYRYYSAYLDSWLGIGTQPGAERRGRHAAPDTDEIAINTADGGTING
jgi:sporulation protein YlmC with PRC-barrel domain